MTIWPFVFLVSTCDPAPALEGKRLFERGRFEQAESYFRRALEQPCGDAQTLANRINLAATLRERGAIADALRLLRETAMPDDAPAETRTSYWNSLALAEDQAGNREAAEAAFRRALASLTPLTPSRLCIQVWTNYARHWLQRGRLNEAEAALREAQAQPGWQHDRPLAFDLNHAELRRLQGRPREAEEILRPLLRQSGLERAQRGNIANNMASLVAARGANREAERLWREAIGDWRAAYGPAHRNVARALSNLAAHYFAHKRYREAEVLYREAIAIDPHPLLLNNLGALLHDRGQPAEAEQLYRRAARAYEPPNEPGRDAIQLYGNLAVLLARNNREDESLRYFEKMVALLPLAVPADEPVAARFLEQYELTLRRRHASAEAERMAALAMRYRVRTALRQ